MPSAFDKRFQRSASPAHQREFGEPIVYFPRAGGNVSFDAIIDRNPPAFYVGTEVVLPEFTIRFENDCDRGMLASKVDAGDSVDLIAELGDVRPTRVTVMRILSQVGGEVVVALKGD